MTAMNDRTGQNKRLWVIARQLAAACALALVSACGGGGSSPSQDPPQTQSPQPAAVTITQQPLSVSAADQEDVQLSVLATGEGPLGYQWKKDEADVAGATAAVYSRRASYSDNGSKFTVVVTGANGSKATSSAAILLVRPSNVAIVQQPPSALTGTVGQSFVLDVQAGGTGPFTYQWFKNGAALSGATGRTYTVTAVTQADNNAVFSVAVTGASGTVQSNVTTLSIAPVAQPPVVTVPAPAVVSAELGGRVVLSTTVTSSEAVAFQWSRDAQPLAGATAATYTIDSVTAQDNGATFSVTATNSAGSVTSDVTTLQVNLPMVITGQPQAVSATAGATARVGVVVSGSGPFQYQWKWNGSNIIGATGSSYTTPVLSIADSGTLLSVEVSDIKTRLLSNTAALTVVAAPAAAGILVQPAAASVRVGQKATFAVQASGTGPFRYQWFKNGELIAGATGSSFTTGALTLGDSGLGYAVEVTGAIGQPAMSAAALLTVRAAIAKLATGNFHTLALTTDGLVYSVGGAVGGVLGSAPPPGKDGVPARINSALANDALANVVAIAGGGYHSLALRADGTVWAWGDGNYGALGDAFLSSHFGAEAKAVRSLFAERLTGITAIAAGYQFSLAVRGSDGSVWSWGNDSYGKLGDGPTIMSHKAAAVQVLDRAGAALVGVTKVAAAGQHAAAIKGGRVLTWGDGPNGELGDGVTRSSTYPVVVESSPGVPLENIVDISAGTYHMVALAADGTVWTWGLNTSGALCAGSTAVGNRAIRAVDSSGKQLTGTTAIAAGFNATLLLNASGSVLFCGDTSGGKSGLAPFNNYYASVVPVGKADQISMTAYHAVVRTLDGSVFGWGLNNANQLGVQPTTSVNVLYPSIVPGL